MVNVYEQNIMLYQGCHNLEMFWNLKVYSWFSRNCKVFMKFLSCFWFGSVLLRFFEVNLLFDDSEIEISYRIMIQDYLLICKETWLIYVIFHFQKKALFEKSQQGEPEGNDYYIDLFFLIIVRLWFFFNITNSFFLTYHFNYGRV